MFSRLVQDVYVVICLAALLGLAALILRPHLRERFARRAVGSATAVDLAFVRIATCAVLILYVLNEDAASMARLGPKWFDPPGYLDWLGRAPFDWFWSSAFHLRVLTWVTVGVLTLAMAGCLTRVTVALAALLYFFFLALLAGFGKEFHAGCLGLYAIAVLCFLPCGDAWSVDSRWLGPVWRRWRGRSEPSAPPTAAYSWGVYACYAAIALPYLSLGMAKLIAGGPFWFDGRSLRNYMLIDDLNLHDYNIDLALRLHDIPTILWTIAGLFALTVELTYCLVLVSPRARRILPACVAMLHVAVWFGQDALFLDAALIPMIFIRPSQWLARRGPDAQTVSTTTGSPATPWARARAWLRGPTVPIGLVFVMLFLHYTTYRDLIPWRWPVIRWTMYRNKASTEPVVSYRRFVAHRRDGTSEPTSLGDAIGFLAGPYQLDRGLQRDLPRFLQICLRELRRRQGSDIDALTYERRTWRYAERSLEAHLDEAATSSYRVADIPPPPRELVAARLAENDLVRNGGFTRWDKAGLPATWKVDASWLGMGIALGGNERAALLAASPAPQSLSQVVTIPVDPTGTAYQLRAQALVRTSAAGATLELEVEQAGEPQRLEAEAPPDGAWHLVEVGGPVATGSPTRVRVVLRSKGAGDAYFDDVRLSASPAAAP